MATRARAAREEEAIAAYEDAVRGSADVNVSEALAMRRLFRAHGFTYVDDSEGSPVEKLDNDAIKGSIFVIAPDHRVSTRDDRSSEPIHRHVLAGEILKGHPVPPPHGDSDAWDALGALERATWKKAEGHIWKLIDDKFGGTLQRWMRERLDEELVLVKAGDYLFVTDEPKYVEAEIWRRYTDKAEIQMIAAAEQMALFGRQLPALKRRAVPALNKATKQATDKAMAAYTLRAQENGEEE
jgi:hypothetical protein